MNECISVIVPVYNASGSLVRCIRSILNQRYSNLELLLINDGSTDGSGQLCEQFEKLYPQIKVYHQKHRGAAAARNRGLREAGGAFIAFVDADDRIEPCFLERLYSAITHYNCEVVVSGFRIEPNGVPVMPGFPYRKPMDGRTFVLSSATIHSSNDLCFVWRSLYSTQTIRRNNIQFHEELRIGEDTIFNLQLYTSCQRICAIEEAMYHYSIGNTGSLMNTPHIPELKTTLELQYQLRYALSAANGLISIKRYRRDLADYYLKAILARLIHNMQNAPEGWTKTQLTDLLHSELVTESANTLGFGYSCRSWKEYVYYLAVKFKLSTLLYTIVKQDSSQPANPRHEIEQQIG